MYREADQYGCEPQPGMSLLRLAEGKLDAAAALIRGVADSAGHRQGPGAGSPRSKLLGPYVEILIADGDLDTARVAADELAQIATTIDAPILLAISTQTTGAVLFAEGKMKAALALLREAWAIWQQLEIPYESARVRVLIGQVSERRACTSTPRVPFSNNWVLRPIWLNSNG
jgi:ATP/maltotriose-dependent transcriptional regulator MalT